MLHITCFDAYEPVNVVDLVRYLYIFYGHLKNKGGGFTSMPPCLQEESKIWERICKEKWCSKFPDFEIVRERLISQDPLFKPPQDSYHYLYYHLLCSMKGKIMIRTI